MGTRGAVGFIKDNKLVASYNHFDSYPEVLGVNNLKHLKFLLDKFGVKKLDEALSKIRIMDDDKKAGIRLSRKLAVMQKSNENNTEKSVEELAQEIKEQKVYSAMREYQGNMVSYVAFKTIMANKKDEPSFLESSLWCEWAYIWNLDTHELEVYRGFMHSSPKNGFFKGSEKTDGEYYPCEMVTSFPFNNLPTNNDFLLYSNEVEEKTGVEVELEGQKYIGNNYSELSSWINFIGYNSENKTTAIETQDGTVMVYENIDPELYNEFFLGVHENVGKTYHKFKNEVKKRYA